MSTTKTISALLGPTLVATGIAMLINLGTFPVLAREVSHSPLVIMIAGYAAFVPGLAIVYFHNKWSSIWAGIISAAGWLALVVGFLRIVFPFQVAALAGKAAAYGSNVFLALGAVVLVIGAYLSCKVYMTK